MIFIASLIFCIIMRSWLVNSFITYVCTLINCKKELSLMYETGFLKSHEYGIFFGLYLT